jgi:peptide/nickel transport system permease protein
MGNYLLKRMLINIPVLLVVSLLIFGGVRYIPGDVCRVILQSPEVKQEQCDNLYHALGMDRPAYPSVCFPP